MISEIEDLPDENLHLIFQFLNTNELLQNCVMVCKRWSSVASEMDIHIVISGSSKRAIGFLDRNVRNEKLINMKSLHLPRNRLSYKNVENIIYSKYMVNITDLDLSYNNIGSEFLLKQMKKGFKNLKSLNLRYTAFHDSIVNMDAFGMDSSLRNLTSLDLSFAQLEKEGAEYISNNLINLQTLKLVGCFVGNEGLKHICNNLEQLTCLDLSTNDITNEGIRHLAKFPLKNLKSLSISNNLISYSVWKELFSSPAVFNLTYLNVSRNEISLPETSCQNMPNLTHLNLAHCDDLRYYMKYLQNIINVSQLVSLNLAKNSIGNEAVSFLRGCKNLRELDLSKNNLTSRGISALSEFDMPNLTLLNLRGNDVDNLDIATLNNSVTLPNLRESGIKTSL